MVVRLIIAIIAIAATGVYSAGIRGSGPATAGIPDVAAIPVALGEWRGEDLPVSENVARVLGADVTLSRRYAHQSGSEVWFYVSYFAQQRVNSQIHSPRNCIPGAGWTVREIENTGVVVNGTERKVTRMRVGRLDVSQEVLYWFRTRGGDVTGEYALKWDLVKRSLAREPSDAAFIRFSAATQDSMALVQFMDLIDSPLRSVLADVGL